MKFDLLIILAACIGIGVAPLAVERRIKLAAEAPVLIELLRQNEIRPAPLIPHCACDVHAQRPEPRRNAENTPLNSLVLRGNGRLKNENTNSVCRFCGGGMCPIEKSSKLSKRPKRV